MTSAKEKNIWILSELYYPEDSATGYYITKIAEALAVNYHIRVLSVQPTYGARGTKAPANEVRSNVQVHRCRATTFNKDILIFRLVNILTISVSIFINALVRIKKEDIVLVGTNPPTLPFVAFIASKLRGAKLILRVEDVYPEVLVAAGVAKVNSKIVKALDVLHCWLYKRVDRIIVLGRDMKCLIQTKIGGDGTTINIIPHFADDNQITPQPRDCNPLLQKLGLVDKFVIQYSGNMGRTHGLECLLQCANILKTNELFHFLFIGSGAKEIWLRKSTYYLKLKNVTFLPPQPRSELNISLNACDIAVISFVNGMSGVSVPSRMYNIMSAGKPILAVTDGESELARVVEEENIGWVVKPEMPDLIANAVMGASSNRELLLRMSLKARSLAVEKYSQAHIIQMYVSLLDSMGLSNKSKLLDTI
jgi:colanic acid biosynthesis glycosyl transferase WcaI